MKRIFFLLCLSVCTYTVQAQVTTSTIRGTILDEAGEGIPGATIKVVHEPTGTVNGTATMSNGKFTIANLRVGGPYTITVSSVGYQTIEYVYVSLSLGQAFDVDVTMKADVTELSEVTVMADPTFNDTRTGAADAYSTDAIRNMPNISRSASDITKLTPSSDGNSFAGRNDQYNNFSLNGAIFNNPFGLDAATPGGQTNAQPISLDAIDQIQVSIAPYDVTQAGFTGASVNAVTKSGTNDIQGTVFGFYRNDAMTGSKVSGTDIIVPELSQVQTGFSLGGPIVKNKLFFFANAELERRDDAGSNFVADNGSNTGGANVSRVLVSDLEAVSDALGALGYETGPYQGYTHETNNIKGIIKLDYNLSSKHKVTGIYNFLDAERDLNAHPLAIQRRGPSLTTLQYDNSGYQINNEINSGILEVRSNFNSRMSNKFQVGYTHFNDFRVPKSAPAPAYTITKDGIPYIIAGHEPFSINNRLDQKVFQFSNNLTIYGNNHTFTVGTSFEKFQFDNSFNLTGYGFDVFGTIDIADFLIAAGDGTVQTALDNAQTSFDTNNANNTWALAETNVGQWAVYAQDEIALNDKLRVTIGLRADIPLYFDTPEKIQENIDRKGGLLADGGTYDPSVTYYDENNKAIQFDHTVLPKSTPLLSPRVGFNYDVKGDQTDQLRGGTGFFTGRLPFVWIGNQVANPDFFFYNVTHPDFKFPQVWRSNLGYDKKFSNGLTLSTDVIFTKDLNAMMVRNYGLRTPGGNLNGVDNRETYRSTSDRALEFGAPTNAYVFTNTNDGQSFNWTIQAKKTWANGMFGSIGYNYLDARDASSIEAEISSDAYDRNPALGNVNRSNLTPSLYGNKHRVVGTFNKKISYSGDKMATTFSLFFEYAQGGRFSYTYAGDINGDGGFNNDLIYIPTDSEIDAMNFSGDAVTQRAAMKAFFAQDDYLSERRGEYAQKYDILSPWNSTWDLRVLQDFKLGGNTLQLSVDVLNLGNMLNSNWGVKQAPTNIQPIGVSVTEDGNGDLDPVYTFDTSVSKTYTDTFDLISRWRMQFGVRYSF
jgi:hypothetical protein